MSNVQEKDTRKKLTEEAASMMDSHAAGHRSVQEDVIVRKVFDGEEIDVICHHQPATLGFRTSYYPPPDPCTEFINGIRCDRDVEVPISGGRKIYVDIYRLERELTNLPTILVWTPFGKRHGYGTTDEVPGLQKAVGVPKEAISKMQAFEGADPGFWCYQGYCVINADATGTGYSTGNNGFMTAQGGKDGAELVDWIGEQEWSNGKVGLFGNSGLSMMQWMIAAERPKHLACIAPWEGTADLYRESLGQGGITAPAFADIIFGDFRGPGLQEDPGAMLRKYPCINGYWKDKEVRLENIRIPAYVCCCYAHFHNRGSIQGFSRIKSRNKWLRIHSEFEWPDAVNPENRADAKLFFDRYLKGIHNGWELTPKVRMDVTDAYEYDFRTKRPEEDFPLPRTQYTKYYLNAGDQSFSTTPVPKTASITYDSVNGDVSFDIKLTEDTELSGHFVLRVWVSAEIDDADIFCTVQKLGVDGEFIPTLILGANFNGAAGRLRASMRELDTERSFEYLPRHKFLSKQPLKPGEIVPLDIEIWPYFRMWHKGEVLRVNIAGRPIMDPTWFLPTFVDSINEGNHTIHTGGMYDSYLLAPVIPPKYKTGDYEVR